MLAIHHKQLTVPDLKRSYKILQISDSHLTLFGPDEPEKRAQYAAKRFLDGKITKAAYLAAKIDYAIHEKVDAVILSGDIIDFPSPENIEFLKTQLARLPMPYLYIFGNHDWQYFDETDTEYLNSVVRPQFDAFFKGDSHWQTLKIGELCFAGIDNSADYAPAGTASLLEKLSETENDIILVQHVPLYSETLAPESMKVWQGRDICLGGLSGIPDAESDRVIRLISQNPAFKAVIAGHLHFEHFDYINSRIPQYVAGQGNLGDCSLFDISPSK